jgi:glycosyltransferase involved in cell wall biosynthesis
MRILVWQWGRFGAGPRVAVDFATGFNALPGTDAVLSLSTDAELLHGKQRPRCELPVPTYASVAGYLGRMVRAPAFVPWLARQVRALAPTVALCAMPGPLDLLMAAALRRAAVPFAVVVHDADLHPGDGYILQMTLQQQLVRRADAVVTLSEHVRRRLTAQGLARGKPMLSATLPPYMLPEPPPPPRMHGGKLRLLSFGRLLPYKGLDILADSLRRLLPRDDLEVRIIGEGPESPILDALRRLPGVSVENRWVPEEEVGTLLAWADAVVLSHREASQSGVAAAAAAAGRWVVATRVGGLAEQLKDAPNARLCAPEPGSLLDALLWLMDKPADVTLAPAPAWIGSISALSAGLERTLGATKSKQELLF